MGKAYVHEILNAIISFTLNFIKHTTNLLDLLVLLEGVKIFW